MENKPTHISGFVIDHIYSRKLWWNNSEKYLYNCKNIYFSDNDAVRIVTEKNSVDFHINS